MIVNYNDDDLIQVGTKDKVWKYNGDIFTGIIQGYFNYYVISNGKFIIKTQNIKHALLHPAIIRYELFGENYINL